MCVKTASTGRGEESVNRMRIGKGKIFRRIALCMAVILSLASVLNTAQAGGMAAAALAGTKAATAVAINETNFPDAKFRAYIQKAFDTNNDKKLDADEILVARNVECQEMGIESLQGIEFLTELRGLYCMDNKIKTMDLSKNKLLTGVWCSGNLFTSLDFTPNPNLEWVYCFDCKLTSLNVSNNPEISYIECNTNPLKKLDVTHNPKLEHLMCGSCELSSLDLSRNPNLQHLDAFNNHFTKLDVTHNPKLKRLDVWENAGLGSIDVSKCKGLQYYNCAYNDAKSVDVSNNPELTKLICSYNDLTKLDVSHNPKLYYLDCADNQIASLDLSKNPKLTFLQAFINNFTKLDVSSNPYLVKAYKEGKKEDVFGIAHEWTLDFGGLTSTGEKNAYYICFDDKVKLTTESAGAKATPTPTKAPAPTGSTADLITREKAAQTLYEMAGKPDVSGLTSRFKDVKKGASYEKALLWGEKNSICVGYPEQSSDKFGVGEYITRQDLALMLMRFSEYMGYKRAIDFGRSDDFQDYYEIDSYAWEAVCWACTWNIMVGKGDPSLPKSERKFEPHGTVTKEDLATILARFNEVNAKVTPKVNNTTPTPTPKAEKATPTVKPTATPSPKPSATPKATETPKATPTPKMTETPGITATPQATVTPETADVTAAPEMTVTPDVTAAPELTTTPAAEPTGTAEPTITGSSDAAEPSATPAPDRNPAPTEALTPADNPTVSPTPVSGETSPAVTEISQETKNSGKEKKDENSLVILLAGVLLGVLIGSSAVLIIFRKKRDREEGTK